MAGEIANFKGRRNPQRADEPGRNTLHGATGNPAALGPIREAMARDLRADYPHLDERRLAILADRLARMESARRWLDEQGGVVRDKRGEVWGVIPHLEKWSGAAERLLAQAEAEAREPVPVEQRLREHLEAKAR